jgi:hypothetical protein
MLCSSVIAIKPLDKLLLAVEAQDGACHAAHIFDEASGDGFVRRAFDSDRDDLSVSVSHPHIPNTDSCWAFAGAA